MYNDLSTDEQNAIYNYGLQNGLDVNNPQVLDDLAEQYLDLINVNLVNEIPPVYVNGAVISTSQAISMTQNEIIDIMYQDTLKNLEEYEENLVKISHNSKCSPLCIHGQGKVFWVLKKDPKYDSLDENSAQGSGTTTQLFHRNCRHNMSVYFEGYSDPPKGSGNISEIEKNYQNDQNVKYVDRNTKKWFDKKERARITNDPKQEYYTTKWKEWNKRK